MTGFEKRLLAWFIGMFACASVSSQQFLNGSFEINQAVPGQINLPNSTFNAQMPNATAFGSLGNIDIINSVNHCGPAQDGDWFVALTGGGTDALSLTLSADLVQGNRYQLTFFDRICPPESRVNRPVLVGLSDRPDRFGELVQETGLGNEQWTQRTITFTAPISGRYVTLRTREGNSFDTWVQFDNFSMECPQSVDLGNDTILCNGQELRLFSGVPGGTHAWQNGSTADHFIVRQAGTYAVTVTQQPCVMQDGIVISYRACVSELHLPAAFTPNADGLNDFFGMLPQLDEREIKVYNRAGQILFAARNPGIGWDGRYQGVDQPTGVYVYVIRFRDHQSQLVIKRGTVALIR